MRASQPRAASWAMSTNADRPLDAMPLRELRELARERRIFRYARMRKAQLRAALRELAEEEAHPSAATPPPDAETVAALDAVVPELPTAYGQDRIGLLPYDPGQVYAYWELSEARKARARQAPATCASILAMKRPARSIWLSRSAIATMPWSWATVAATTAGCP
ncbi:MAG: hypothetical protein BRC58_02885 [Cyanobacteria bacterium QS_8_64_29]|nr:MAG: hypothetical protein BRC58_02885 [Cyanobacteria bacterium QS_8_64_29]